MYKVVIKSIDDAFSMDFVLCETPAICSKILVVKNGDWMKQLEQLGIKLTESSATRNMVEAIDIVIGSDYWNVFITSAPTLLLNGLAAVQTKFRWTISGPAPDDSVVQYHLHQEQICQLWELDALGIKSELIDSIEELVQQQFNVTVQRDSDGRYIVALPWKEDPTVPSNNHAVALK